MLTTRRQAGSSADTPADSAQDNSALSVQLPPTTTGVEGEGEIGSEADWSIESLQSAASRTRRLKAEGKPSHAEAEAAEGARAGMSTVWKIFADGPITMLTTVMTFCLRLNHIKTELCDDTSNEGPHLRQCARLVRSEE